MSIKRFCDSCGTEVIRNYVSQRLKLRRRGFTAEVMLTYGSTCNSGEICRACLNKLLALGKEIKL